MIKPKIVIIGGGGHAGIILDCIKAVLGYRFTSDMEKKFVKQYNPIIKQVPELVK